MKLISTFFSKKTFALAALVMATTILNARVFWNKVEATVTNDNIVTLSWNVTEYNNKNFLIEHSVDGVKWETIATIESKNSPQSMTDYSYTHKNRLSGKQYYRLKDVDIDISYTSYSPIKTLLLKTDRKGISLWPNPATDRILLENNDNNIQYTSATVTNLAGKVLLEKKLTADLNEIGISALPAGMYIVKLEAANGSCQSQKFIKQ